MREKKDRLVLNRSHEVVRIVGFGGFLVFVLVWGFF